MPMTKEERAAYNKAYRERKKEELKAKAAEKYKAKAALMTEEEKKERSAKVIAARKGKEEERLDKERAVRAAGGAKTRARYMKQTPEEKVAAEASRVEKQRADKKIKAPKKEYTAEELAAKYDERLAKQRERYQKKKAAEREKADAEARARAEAADMEAREREKETRAKVLEKGKEEVTPAVRPVSPEPEPEPVPRTTAGVPEPEPAPVIPAAPGMADVVVVEDKKATKRRERIEELKLRWARRELGITPKTDGTYKELMKEVKNLKLAANILSRPPDSWKETIARVRSGERVPTQAQRLTLQRAAEEMEEAEKQVKRGEYVDVAERMKANAEERLRRARSAIAAAGGGAMMPMMSGFV